jgi:hypothetical protein
VDAELQYMQARLRKLAAEIDAAAAQTEKQGLTFQFAQQVSEAVAHLRHLLKQEQVALGHSAQPRPRRYTQTKR